MSATSSKSEPSSSTEAQIPSSGDPIHTYRIDLSLPPSERYVQLATEMAPEMRLLNSLFDEIIQAAFPSPWVRRCIKTLAWLLLRRVYSAEETAEIKSMSNASGVGLYSLVALNVFLDGMMGCTSGAVMTTPKESKGKGKGEEKRMMHFRTLDWGMEPLRSILVVLEFVKTKSEEPERVVGRTITYAGYVGVLTGVREDLSVSLNFRPNHECSTFRLQMHQLAILLGFRPSIAHILRSATFSSEVPPPLEDLAYKMSTEKTAPCYLILCDGKSTAVLEKDLLSAKIRTSDEFIVHTNNDTTLPTPFTKSTQSQKENEHSVSELLDELGMDAFLEDSRERQACMQKKWDALKSRQRRKQQVQLVEESEMVGPSVREVTLVGWLKSYPTMNDQTQFACVMDPKRGEIRWLERGEYWDSGDEVREDRMSVSDNE